MSSAAVCVYQIRTSFILVFNRICSRKDAVDPRILFFFCYFLSWFTFFEDYWASISPQHRMIFFNMHFNECVSIRGAAARLQEEADTAEDISCVISENPHYNSLPRFLSSKWILKK